MKLSEKTQGVLLIIIVVIFLAVAMIPMVYWFNHATLTKIEILKEFWELYVGLTIGMLGIQYFMYKYMS